MTNHRYDLIAALYALCSDYHSGQWSRGYKLLSRIETRYRPNRMPTTRSDLDRDEWFEAANIYDQLKTTYAHKL